MIGFSRQQLGVVFLLGLFLMGVFAARNCFINHAVGRETARPGYVYEIRGDVQNPGFYTYPEKQTPAQLINACEGTADGIKSMDLKTPLKNGTRITLRQRITVENMGANARLNFFLPLDVNRASAGDLTLIWGVGPKTAEAIVRYRNENGMIRDMGVLSGIRGIGQKRLEKITPYLGINIQ